MIFGKDIYKAGAAKFLLVNYLLPPEAPIYHLGNWGKLPFFEYCGLNQGYLIQKENFLNEWLLILKVQ